MREPSGKIVLTPKQVEALIENGHAIVILGQHVLNLDSWLNYHPGGAKVILHVVGRDATDEINAFHSKNAKARIQRYCIGIIEDRWQNLLPPIQRKWLHSNNPDKGIGHEDSLDAETNLVLDVDPKKQDEIVTKFRLLISRLEAEGLYDCNYYQAYATEAFRCTVLFALMLIFLRRGWYATSAAFLGCFWHQIVASAHDAGHLALTQSYNTDTIIGTIILNHMGGLSLGWWKRNHNIHHVVTNSPSHDQDIQILPFIAISPKFFDSLYSTASECIMHYNKLAQFLVPHQAWLYYLLLSVGRFNLYYLAWDFILRDLSTKVHRWHRLFELSGQIFFWTWFGYFLVYCSIPTLSQRIVFILIAHMITLPLHLQLTISHFSMSTAESVPSETWPQRMFRTTMDIDCEPWMDWFHGGLQFQVTHHLFPRMPRHNLRRASAYVKDFCAEIGLKYEVYGFEEGNGRLYKRLAEVARQASYLKDCQDSVVQKGDYLRGHWD